MHTDADALHALRRRRRCLGLVVGDGLTIGFAPSGFQQIASNIVNYTFCKSVSAPNDFALFETHDPWGVTVVKDAITAAGHTYTDVYAAIRLGWIRLQPVSRGHS